PARVEVGGRDEAVLDACADRETPGGSKVHAVLPARGDVASKRIGVERHAARDPVEVRRDVEGEGIPAAVCDPPAAQIDDADQVLHAPARFPRRCPAGAAETAEVSGWKALHEG